MIEIQLSGAHVVSGTVVFRVMSGAEAVTFIIARATLEDMHGSYLEDDLQTLAAFESGGLRIREAVRKVIARNLVMPHGDPPILTSAEFSELY